jgi:hypothetical protein
MTPGGRDNGIALDVDSKDVIDASISQVVHIQHSRRLVMLLKKGIFVMARQRVENVRNNVCVACDLGYSSQNVRNR